MLLHSGSRANSGLGSDRGLLFLLLLEVMVPLLSTRLLSFAPSRWRGRGWCFLLQRRPLFSIYNVYSSSFCLFLFVSTPSFLAAPLFHRPLSRFSDLGSHRHSSPLPATVRVLDVIAGRVGHFSSLVNSRYRFKKKTIVWHWQTLSNLPYIRRVHRNFRYDIQHLLIVTPLSLQPPSPRLKNASSVWHWQARSARTRRSGRR